MSFARPHRHALGMAIAGLMAATASQSLLAQAALEEIIVTAQKRAENVQDTPIAMSALSTGMLESRGIENVGDIIRNVPGLGGFEAPGSRGNISINIRGVSTGNPSSPSIDPANGMYIDGVYIGKAAGSSVDVAELERVEVLRGPQGTLYGRNSVGGAINFITKKPTGELGFKITGTVGNYDLKGYKTNLDLPSIGTEGEGLGTLATSFAMQGRTRDALYDNTNEALDGFENLDRQAYRFAARWQPADTVTVDYAYDYSEIDENAPLVKTVGFTPTAGALAGTSGYPTNTSIYGSSRGDQIRSLYGLLSLNPSLQNWADRYLAMEADVLGRGMGRPNRGSSDVNSFSATEHDGHALTIAWDAGDLGALGEVEFKSITAYREMDNQQGGDLDGLDNTASSGVISDSVILNALRFLGNPAQLANYISTVENAGSAFIFANAQSTKYQQLSQELQMNGSTDRVEYTVGLFYFEDESEFRNLQNALFPLVSSGSTSYDNSTEAQAVFGQATWTPAILEDRLALTLGLRYTEETRDVTYLWRGLPNGNYVSTLEQAGNMPPVAGIYGRTFKQNFYNTSGKFTAAYQALDNMNVFVTYSTGYRSGGFNGDFFDALNNTANTFNEETIEQLEIGVKSDWWDNRLRVNASLYTYEYDDLQVSLVKELPNGGVASGIENGGMAERWGAELEVQVSPVEDLLVSMSYNYLNGDFDEYKDLCAPEALPGANQCITSMAKDGRRAQSPSNSVTLGVDYTVARWDAASLKVAMDASWSNAVASISHVVGNYDTNRNGSTDTLVLFDHPEIDERTVVNGRLTLDDIQMAGGILRMGLWGKNLFDQDYRTFAVNLGGLGPVTAQYGEPRTYGLDVTWEY